MSLSRGGLLGDLTISTMKGIFPTIGHTGVTFGCLHIIMAITIEQHRAAIGKFNGRSQGPGKSEHRFLTRRFKTFWLIYMLCLSMNIEINPWVALLIAQCMDVESNPGPLGNFEDTKITICNANLLSINAKPRTSKISRFQALKNELSGNFDIITTTETWLKSDHPDSDYVLPGYNGPYRLDRSDDTGSYSWPSDR